MTSVVHEFDAREGGSFRVSLTYDAPTAKGKTAARTDTYHGSFAKLVPNEHVVEVLEFEASDPKLRDPGTEIRANAWRQLLPLAATGKLTLLPAKTYPLTAAAQAHTLLSQGHPNGKLALLPAQ